MSYIGNSPGVASQRVVTTFTATSNQTTFTPTSGYTLGYCDVYFNGVKLVAGDDYTAADGVSVVLASGAAANDVVEVVAHFPRGLSDGYLKAEADAKFVALTGNQTVAGVKTFSSGIAIPRKTWTTIATFGTTNKDWSLYSEVANNTDTLSFLNNTDGKEVLRMSYAGDLYAPSGRISKLGTTTSAYLSTGEVHGDSATLAVVGGDSAATAVAVRLYNGGYYYPVSFSNTGPVTASSTSPNYISNRTSPGVGNENGRWEGRAGNAAYSSGIRSFVASGQPGVDRVSAAIFTSTYTSSMQTAIDRLIVDDVGRVTIPNQPCWVLRPGGNSNETLGSNPTILGWTSSGGFMQGVSLSASSGTLLQNAGNAGRINVPVSGRYALWVSVRLENNPTAGQIWVRKNGVDLFRQHVEVWGRFPYGHAFAYHVASASAGDYFEVVVQSSTGVISGTNDTVNWFSGHLLG